MMSYLCHRFEDNPNRESPAYGNAKIAISAQSSAHYCTFHSHRRDQKKPEGSIKPKGLGKSDSSDRPESSDSSYIYRFILQEAGCDRWSHPAKYLFS